MTAAVAAPSPFLRRQPPAPDQLSEILAAASERTDHVRAGRGQALSALARHQLQALKAERERADGLREELHRIGKHAAGLEELRTGVVYAEKAVNLASAHAANRREAAATALDLADAEYAAGKRDLADDDARLEAERKAIGRKKEGVDNFFELYTAHLGLTIARVAPRTVRITFAALRKQDMDSQYSFVLAVAGLEPLTYAVSGCQPAVPQFPRLVERLNSNATSSSALTTFVCGMRRAFEELA